MKQPASRCVLVIEDDITLNGLLVEQIGRLGYEALGAGSRAAALDLLAGRRVDLAILDLRLPDTDGLTFLPELREYCPAIVLTAQGSIDQAVQAVRAGAADFLVKPATGQMLDLAITRVLGTADLQRDLVFWQEQARIGRKRPLLGSSAAMNDVRRLMSLFAGADSPVLILGEEGTGKESCAAALHALSPRANGRFVAVDCDTAPSTEDLLGEVHLGPAGRIAQSEGLLAAADTGTVYLGAVDRLPADMQNKLLRILETGSYRPVGSNALVPCPARLILGSSLTAAAIAADRDPPSPLLQRMLSFVIPLPALRDRPGDIREMAEAMLANRNFQRNAPKVFGPAALRALQDHGWPGNLRELSNAVERALIMSAGEEVIAPAHLGLAADPPGGRGRAPARVSLSFDSPPTLDGLRNAYLRLLLDLTGSNRREMAAILDISERNLYRLLPQITGTAEPEA